MYSESEEDFKKAVEAIEKNASKHYNFLNRFQNNCKRSEQWVLYKRFDVTYRSHNTNNYAEATIRIFKEIILNRTKAYNVVALVDFIVTVAEEYFTLHILRHAHCRHSETDRLYNRLCSKMDSLDINKVRKIDGNTYELPSMTEENTYYSVNIENGVCSCKIGHTGSFCKHQAWVHKNIKEQLPNTPLVTLSEHHALGLLALGSEKCPKADFFLGLGENPNNVNLCEPLSQICSTQDVEVVQEDTDEYNNRLQPTAMDIDSGLNHEIIAVQAEWSRHDSNPIIANIKK